MKKIPFIITSWILIAGLHSCMQSPAEDSGEATTSTEKEVQPVRAMELKKTVVSQTEKLTATINAYEDTYLAPAISGRIRSIEVDINDRVKKGEVLVRMDRTQLEQTRFQYENQKKDLMRMDTLLQYGSVTQQSYDQLKTQVEVTEVLLENLEENTVLKAPYSGIITGKYYNDGELFSPTPNTPAGKAAILSMVRIDMVKVLVSLPENDLPQVKNGMKAKVVTDVYPKKAFTGTIYRIYPVVNAATRTFDVELHVPNPQEILRPGMFARVTIELGQKEALVVPAISILQQEGTNDKYIFIYDNGKAKRINVKIVERFDDQIEISSPDLHAGEQLIYAGQANLLDGDAVKLINN